MLAGARRSSHTIILPGLRWPGVCWLVRVSIFVSLHSYQALIAVNVGSAQQNKVLLFPSFPRLGRLAPVGVLAIACQK
jgi:hypothetical protein